MSNASAKNVNAPADIKKKSQFVEVWKRLCRNKTAVLGLVIVALLTLMAILSPILIDYETQVIKTNYSEALQAPSANHWFGTDEMGRDILLRVMYGSTVSLSIGVVTVAVSLTVGLILGAAAGYFGGKTDMIIMRIMDIFLAIPGTLLAICIVASLGNSIRTLSSRRRYPRSRRSPVSCAERSSQPVTPTTWRQQGHRGERMRRSIFMSAAQQPCADHRADDLTGGIGDPFHRRPFLHRTGNPGAETGVGRNALRSPCLHP